MSERMTDKRLTAFLRGGESSYGGIEWELLQALKAERATLRAVRDEVDKMDRRIYSGSQWIPNEQHIRLKALLGD